MKRSIIITVFLTVILNVFAEDDVKLSQANSKYEVGNYKEAIRLYEDVLQNGESSVIYYNLGNAYYKANMLGKSILNYERALLLDPGNDDAHYNLELARNRTVDKIDPIDRFFLSKWIDDLSSTRNTNTWAYLSIGCFMLTLIMAGIFIFSKNDRLKKPIFFFGILILLISLITFNFSGRQKDRLLSHEYAVILSPTVTVKGSPDESGTELFVIHEGIKVKIKRTLGDWMEIELSNGNVGWAPIFSGERI